MADHLIVGQKGEQVAALYLKNKGFELLFQNWRHKHLEIDVIMMDAETLVFVEVKTLSKANFGLPFEQVDFKKQQRLARAATIFMGKKKFIGEIRFDIISIFANIDGQFNIRHIKDAFWPD